MSKPFLAFFLAMSAFLSQAAKADCNISVPKSIKTAIEQVTYRPIVEEYQSLCNAKMLDFKKDHLGESEHNLSCTAPTKLTFAYSTFIVVLERPLNFAEVKSAKCRKIVACIAETQSIQEAEQMQNLFRQLECTTL